MKISGGYEVEIDRSDYGWLSLYEWHPLVVRGGYVYAFRREPVPGGKQKTVLMHREILQAGRGQSVAHINLNGLDNRKDNLRLATKAEITSASSLFKSNKTGYRGVSRSGERYSANIGHKGKSNFLGRYDSPEMAAAAYDSAARVLHGKYASLNFGKGEK